MAIDEKNLEKKFFSLTNSQESVQTLSLWILHHKNHFKKIIDVWFKILEKDKISHRLTLFYLANDVIQNAKKKGIRQYLDGFKEVLKKATILVRDDKISPKIDRIFSIWNERNVYSNDYLTNLRKLLFSKSELPTNNLEKESNYTSNRIPTDFSLINLEKKSKDIELIDKSVSVAISNLNVKKIDLINSNILSHLKDKKSGEQCCRELSEIEDNLKATVQLLQKQVDCRLSLLDTLDKCELFYETQNGEVKIVENAYTNFSLRVKSVKNKLSNNQYKLISPLIDAPSPNSDDDLVLPNSNNSPLPGLKSLLNVLNENASKDNKISSLDQRLSNLMQNLPNLDKHTSNKSLNDKTNEQVNWSVNQSKQESLNQINLHHNQSNIIQPPIQQQTPMIPPPPINLNHPPPFIPQIPPPIIDYPNSQLDQNNYFVPHAYAPPLPSNTINPHQLNENTFDYYNHQIQQHHSTNDNLIYNDTVHNNNTASVQQIKSVISTRTEQKNELNESELPYDPYDSVDLNGMDSFEPTDMDLDISDEDEMNRSSNSQRVLVTIETNNDHNNHFSGNNSSFNKQLSSLNNNYNQPLPLQQSISAPPPQLPSQNHSSNLHPINPVNLPINNNSSINFQTVTHNMNIPPPQLPPHITSSLLTNTTATNSNNLTPNLQQPQQHHNANYNNYNNNNKYNLPSSKTYHHSNDNRATKPRWTNNHQITNNNNNNNNTTINNNFSNNNLSNLGSNSNNNQYGSNRNNRINNWKGNQHKQNFKKRSRSFNKNTNNNNNNNNFSGNMNSLTNLSNNLTHQQQQYQ